MNLQELEKYAEDLWISENPEEIATWNPIKAIFVDAFIKGFEFAMNTVENEFLKIDENSDEYLQK